MEITQFLSQLENKFIYQIEANVSIESKQVSIEFLHREYLNEILIIY